MLFFFFHNEDVDECIMNTHSCDRHADCKNTDGRYTCTCRGGYNDTSGNGTACEGKEK